MKKNNFDDLIKQLQEKVNSYSKMLEERKKLIGEFTELTCLLNELRKKKDELIQEYNSNPTFKLRKRIEEYSKEENDYIELINECATKINELKSADNYEKDKEFLEVVTKYYRVSSRLKEIEMMSKKLNSKETMYSNIINIVNADGRKKRIHSSLITEYKIFLDVKKVLLPLYKNGYKDYIARYNYHIKCEDIIYYSDERLGISPNYIPSNDEYSNMSNQDKIELEKDFLNDMSLQEKITYYEDQLNRILSAKNSGKKEYIKINDEKYYVPIKMKSLFISYYKILKNLTSNQKTKPYFDNLVEVTTKPITPVEVVESQDEEKLPIIFEETVEELPIMDEKPKIVKEEEPIVEFEVTKHTPNFVVENFRKFMSDNTKKETIEEPKTVEDLPTERTVIFEYVTTNDSTNDELVTILEPSFEESFESNKQENIIYGYDDVEEKEPNVIDLIDNEEVLGNDSDEEVVYYYGNKDNKEDTYQVIKSKKSKNRKGMFKKIVAASLALVAGLTIVKGLKSFFNKESEAVISNNPSICKNFENMDYINNTNFDKQINDATARYKKETNKNQVSNVEQQNSSIKIGDAVTVREGAPIFSNVYDAMKKAHAKNTYFPSSMERNVLGIFIKYDHKFYYSKDQIEIDELLSKGGVIKSYVIGKDGYEGAFHPDDMVKVKFLGRMSR